MVLPLVGLFAACSGDDGAPASSPGGSGGAHAGAGGTASAGRGGSSAGSGGSSAGSGGSSAGAGSGGANAGSGGSSAGSGGSGAGTSDAGTGDGAPQRDSGTSDAEDPSDPRVRNCLAKPSRCGFPDDTNTGVPPGTSLSVMTGDTSFDTDGMVIEGKDIRGCVTINAKNVTIRRSKITCGWAFAVRSEGGGLLIEDSEVTCDGTTATGIVGHGFTVRRTNVHGCENGFDPSDDTTIEDNWIHDLTVTAESHTDGIQVGQGVGPLTIRHNTFALTKATNAAIIMWDEADPQNHDVAVTHNLFDGGGWTIYCSRRRATNIVVTDNRFGVGRYGPASSCSTDTITEWAHNIFDATGEAVPP